MFLGTREKAMSFRTAVCAAVSAPGSVQRPGRAAAMIGEFGRGEWSQTSTTDLSVPPILSLAIEFIGAERWLRALTA